MLHTITNTLQGLALTALVLGIIVCTAVLAWRGLRWSAAMLLQRARTKVGPFGGRYQLRTSKQSGRLYRQYV